MSAFRVSATLILAALSVCEAGCRARTDDEPRGSSAGAAAPPRYLKGQLHVHTDNSGDSQTPAAEVARWYAERGFDFLVFTDHNVVTSHRSSEILTIPGVELTQNLRTCDPPPPTGGACLLHINALFVGAASDGPVTMQPPASLARVEIYERALERSRAWGAIAQLNHPNMGWAVDAALGIELARRGVVLLEIANQNEVGSNGGDRDHPSTEALWDQMLSAGAMIYGVATDDAHHYTDAEQARRRGETALVGNLGYVMVRSAASAGAIQAALARGEFYSTTGVQLARAEARDGALVIEVIDDGGGPYEIRFIGQGGRELRADTGTRARLDLAAAPAGYVRATVTDRPGRRAWIQPIRTPPR
jgi:hypothetical protein